MNLTKDNVKKVVSADLCMGCGMCEVVCPTAAIQLWMNPSHGHFEPKINLDLCVHCGNCLQTCGGWEENMPLLQKEKHGASAKYPFLGTVHSVLAASSLSEDVHSRAASGGFVTTLLQNLLQSHTVDAVLVADTTWRKGVSLAGHLVTAPADLLDFQRSMYLNVPILRALKQVIGTDKKVAVVALPCHLHSLHKSFNQFPSLKQNVIFTIGLMCGGTYKTAIIEKAAQLLSLPVADVQSVQFRTGTWPGRMKITTSDGNIHLIKRPPLFRSFYLSRCFVCNDLLNDLADVSVGDNWSEDKGHGESLAIVRNAAILPFLDGLEVRKLSPEILYHSHRLTSRRQKYTKANRFMAKRRGMALPLQKYDQRIIPALRHYVLAFLESCQFSWGNRSLAALRRLTKLKGMLEHHLVKRWDRNNAASLQPSSGTVVMITEADVVGNKGAVAMLYCILDYVKKEVPHAQFIVTSQFVSRAPDLADVTVIHDKDQTFDVSLVRVWLWWLLKKIHIPANGLLNNPVIAAYRKANLVVSASGISFNEDFGMIKLYHFSKFLQLPLLLGIPVIKFTQSFGPFSTAYNKRIASLTLPWADHLFARGYHSRQNLSDLGIEQNVTTVPDIALTLDASCTKRVQKMNEITRKHRTIGIVPNIVCERLDEKNRYIPALIRLCTHIQRTYPNIHLLFMPHMIEKKSAGNSDDLSLCNRIASYCPDPSRVRIDSEFDYTPGETKALIGACDFVVASRFHAVIAALSSAVPTLTIGWHWKYEETSRWFELDDALVQYWQLEKKDVCKLFDDLYERREKVSEELKKILPELEKQAMVPLEYIVEEIR